MKENTNKGVPKRSRRRLLTGLAAGAGVVAAETLGPSRPAFAGTDGDVVLGVDNQRTTGTTGVQSSDITGLHGRTTNTGNNANTGVFGEGPTGVHGTGSYIGVQGDGTTGVAGIGSGYGVYAHSTGGSPGLYALSDGGDGAVSSGSRYGVIGSGSTGVWGRAIGVPPQNGVYGYANNSTASGVYGQNDGTGYGVAGRASQGTGVLADSSNGTALSVSGKAVFSRSGVVTIAAGTASRTVTLAGVTTASMVFAISQQKSSVFVKAAVPGKGSFLLKLSGNAPTGGLKVAYFVLN